MSIETSDPRFLAPSMEIIVEGPEALRQTEMQIAAQVDPWMKPAERRDFEHYINTRSPLNRLMIDGQVVIVPRLRLTVMADAYSIATHPADYGWDILRHRPRKHDATGRLGEYTIGIVLAHDQEGVTYEKAAWYVPHPSNFRARRASHKNITDSLTVRRYVSRTRVANA